MKHILKCIIKSFLKPKLASSNVLFCPNNNYKPKEIQFTMIPNKTEKSSKSSHNLQLINKLHFLWALVTVFYIF